MNYEKKMQFLSLQLASYLDVHMGKMDVKAIALFISKMKVIKH
jgi:hypothetical protein